MIVAEYKCGYCHSKFKVSYFNSQDIPERNVGCPTCRIAGDKVRLIKKVRDERGQMVGAICDDFKAAVRKAKETKKKPRPPHMLYAITILEAERDNSLYLSVGLVEQLNKAIEILNDARYKLVKKEFGVAAERIAKGELKKKK